MTNEYIVAERVIIFFFPSLLIILIKHSFQFRSIFFNFESKEENKSSIVSSHLLARENLARSFSLSHVTRRTRNTGRYRSATSSKLSAVDEHLPYARRYLFQHHVFPS